MPLLLKAGLCIANATAGLMLLFHSGIGLADTAKVWFSQTMETAGGHYIVTLESTESDFALNEYRKWHLVLRDKAGNGIAPARFTISGGMPMHGHGLPSQPQITKHLGDGRFLIEGIRFNMLGKWVFQFDVVTRDNSDSVRFEVVVDY